MWFPLKHHQVPCLITRGWSRDGLFMFAVAICCHSPESTVKHLENGTPERFSLPVLLALKKMVQLRKFGTSPTPHCDCTRKSVAHIIGTYWNQE